MKKFQEMKKNNKGFSLVELIIVIAIMAVLMAVLAPQFLRYVERSRLQSDNTAIGEIANACKVAATDEDVTGEIATAGGSITVTIPVTTAANVGAGGGDLQDELDATIGTVALTSNTYVNGTAPTITVAIDANGVVTVTGANYIDEVGATAAARTF